MTSHPLPARSRALAVVSSEIVRRPIGDGELVWTEEANERIIRVPAGFMRDKTCERVEVYAREHGERTVTLDVCEAGLAEARQSMAAPMRDGASGHAQTTAVAERPETLDVSWSDDALARLEQVPSGFLRDLTRQRLEVFAASIGAERVTSDVMDEKYADWGEGSARFKPTMPWQDDVVQRAGRIPDFVRGMVVNEVERCAAEMGLDVVTEDVLEKAMGAWSRHGTFHSERKPDQHDEDED